MSGYNRGMESYLPTLTVAGVLGFLAPLASTAINRLTWSPQTKQIVAAVVSVAAAILAMLVTNGFTPMIPGQNPVSYWITLALAVIAVSQLAYSLVWKPTGTDAKIAAVTATQSEKAIFLNENTIVGTATVDSTEARTAEAVAESDSTTPEPGYIPRHEA